MAMENIPGAGLRSPGFGFFFLVRESLTQNIKSGNSDKLTWLANQIFTAFPQEVTGTKFYLLDCGCIYYQRVFRDGNLDLQIGIYRDAENGPCEVCMLPDDTWRERVIDKTMICDSQFQIVQC